MSFIYPLSLIQIISVYLDIENHDKYKNKSYILFEVETLIDSYIRNQMHEYVVSANSMRNIMMPVILQFQKMI